MNGKEPDTKPNIGNLTTVLSVDESGNVVENLPVELTPEGRPAVLGMKCVDVVKVADKMG